jgi:hypothetical protein
MSIVCTQRIQKHAESVVEVLVIQMPKNLRHHGSFTMAHHAGLKRVGRREGQQVLQNVTEIGAGTENPRQIHRNVLQKSMLGSVIHIRTQKSRKQRVQ